MSDGWFLPDGPAATEGNLVTPLVHGATSFRRLHDELEQLQSGDRVSFTDWRGDPDERLLDDGPTVAEMLVRLLDRGMEVRGLVWRSHSDLLSFGSAEDEHLGQQPDEAGGEVLLDQWVRWFGSHTGSSRLGRTRAAARAAARDVVGAPRPPA